MGIDYDGGLLVGCHGSELDTDMELPEGFDGDFYDYIHEHIGLSVMSEHFDAPLDCSNVGFKVTNDVPAWPLSEDWLNEVKEKAQKFEDLFGIEPKLIGCQNIW